MFRVLPVPDLHPGDPLPAIGQDVGLGTAYERLAVWRLVERWCPHRDAAALEGPVDEFAGIAGLHLMPLARRGARVTVAVGSADAAAHVRAAYAACRLPSAEIVVGEAAPGRRFDLAFSFGAPSDWKDAIPAAARRARQAIVVVPNADTWGATARRLLGGDLRLPPLDEIEAEIIRHGSIADAAWLDAPWWPDLLVHPGETLLGFALRRPTRGRFVHRSDRFPYQDLRPTPELARALARHPSFEGATGPWGRAFAHHRAYFVLSDS